MRNNKIIALDTNIFIYYFQQHPQFGISAKKNFELLIKNKARAVTSIITLIELLSLKIPETEVNKFKSLYLETPNLATIEINQTIGIEAAKIRRIYGYRLPDAIQLATALYAKADKFITNDQKIKNFPKIKIDLLSSSNN
jgi:predicted nucleic acid-binding protein